MSIISSTGRAKFAIEFYNGIRVSIIFGSMTYSDNNDEDWIEASVLTPELEKLGMKAQPHQITSHTVEIMVFGHDEFTEWFADKYGGNPAGYLSVDLIPNILQRAKTYEATDLASEHKTPKGAS